MNFLRGRAQNIGAIAALAALAPCLAGETLLGFAGTYTRKDSKGIYSFQFDTATGKAASLRLAAETPNPSFLAVHPNRRFLYAVNEIADYQGGKSGSVSAFAIDAKTGGLTPLNTVASRGEGPAHLAIEPGGQWLIAANYAGGSVAVFPIKSDGSLGEASSFLQRSGSSVQPRQKSPHPHQVVFAPGGRILVPDLGTDEVVLYRLAGGVLQPEDSLSLRVPPGSGPRHLALHPGRRFAYVLGELDSSVSVWDISNLQQTQKVSLLPQDYTGRNTSGEVAVDPGGRFLYASNRGVDEIVLFGIDRTSGMLTPAGRFPTLGKTPRHFALDPSGDYLFTSNQDSDTVVVFRVDRETGKLAATGNSLAISMPVCVVLIPGR